MPEHAAFLNAILERPDDDLPRLVYADYLDESGFAERAEFIRVQIELARLEPTDDRFAGLTRREAELLREGVGWYVPGVRGVQTFRRGFVESLDTTAERLIHAPRPLLLLAPIRELRIRNADNAVAELARVPGLDRIETLDLRNNSFGTGDRLARFLELAPLRNVTGLLLLNNQLWRDDVEVLANSERAAQLVSLDLSGNAIGNAGAGVLARADRLFGLRILILRSDELDFRDRIALDGARALAESQTLGQLRTLDIGGHLLGEAGIAEFANAPDLQNLEWIDASFNRIGHGDDPDLAGLLSTPSRARLKVWNFAGSRIGLRAAEGIAVWDQLETLGELILEHCEWQPGARELLASSPWAYKIRMGNPVSGELA